MYNEKNEIEKVNFGDLPVNWNEEEWSEELTGEAEQVEAKRTQKRAKKSIVTTMNGQT